MKKNPFLFAAIAFVTLTALVITKGGNWIIAPGYSIKFSSSNASGVFTAFKGSIIFDENNLPGSSFDVNIDAASVNTGIGLKTKHAKDDSWLDVAKYPSIHFRSGRISKTKNGFEVTGTLDLHGVKKQITIPFTFLNNTFTGNFTIARADYNIGTGSSINKMVADKLQINISVPVTKP